MKLRVLFEEYTYASQEHISAINGALNGLTRHERKKFKLSLETRRPYFEVLADNGRSIQFRAIALEYNDNGVINYNHYTDQLAWRDLPDNYNEIELAYLVACSNNELRKKVLTKFGSHLYHLQYPPLVLERILEDVTLLDNNFPLNLALILLEYNCEGLTSRSTRLDIFNMLAKKNYKQPFTQAELNVFLKCRLRTGGRVSHDLDKIRLIAATPEAKHTPNIDLTFVIEAINILQTNGRCDDEFLTARFAVRNCSSNIDIHILLDTIHISEELGRPLPNNFLNYNKEQLLRLHDNLVELKRQHELNATKVEFNLDILKIKKDGKVELRYLQDNHSLSDEGNKMGHCAGTYAARATTTHAIYSIYYDGKHVGTLSIIPDRKSDTLSKSSRNKLEQIEGRDHTRLYNPIYIDVINLLKKNSIIIPSNFQ